MAEKTGSTHHVLQDTMDEIRARLMGDSEDPRSRYARLQESVTELARKEGFEVTHVIGVGGMGAVVKATDMKLRRTVALKFLPPDLLSDEISAIELRREAEIASRITHENVVHIFSWHEVDKVPFYAMEFIEGQSLDQMVKKQKKLKPNEALRIIGEAARGVEALHDMDIIHRDIKPQNILINWDGRVKIADFGISRTRESMAQEAHRGKIAGTPDFMAPEQARGEAANRQSDIYSLGATLYFMLSGHRPIEVKGDLEVHLAMVRNGKITPLKKYCPRVNPKILRLVHKSLSLNPSRRQMDIRAFRHEVDDAFLENDPSSGSLVYDLYKRYRRVLFSFFLASIAAVVGFYSGKTRGYEQGLRGSVRANAAEQLALPRLEIMRRVLTANPNDQEFGRIYGQMLSAFEAKDAAALDQIVPIADRLVLRWESMRTMELASKDPTSPLAPLALRILEGMRDTESTNADALHSEWRAIWAHFLQTGTIPTEEVNSDTASQFGF